MNAEHTKNWPELAIGLYDRLTGNNAESVAFATEAPFLQQLGMETIVMGPGYIDQAHQPNEYIPLDHLKPAVTALKGLIRQLCL